MHGNGHGHFGIFCLEVDVLLLLLLSSSIPHIYHMIFFELLALENHCLELTMHGLPRSVILFPFFFLFFFFFSYTFIYCCFGTF